MHRRREMLEQLIRELRTMMHTGEFDAVMQHIDDALANVPPQTVKLDTPLFPDFRPKD